MASHRYLSHPSTASPYSNHHHSLPPLLELELIPCNASSSSFHVMRARARAQILRARRARAKEKKNRAPARADKKWSSSARARLIDTPRWLFFFHIRRLLNFTIILKMFVQIHPSDTTNCLHILSSTKPAALIVGLSVTPPVKKSNDQIKQKKQNQVLECLGHGYMSKKNGLERVPGGRVERKYSFSGRFGTQGGGFNGGGQVLEKENVTTDGFLVSPDSRVQKNGCFEVNLRSASGVNGAAEEFRIGDFKRAEEFFKKWSNSVVDERGSAIVWSEAHLQEASETFERMLQKGILPTTVTFNTLIHMFGNNGLLDEVASLMQRMEKDKCSPDTRTYNILISVHAKHNDIDLAARYLTKMKEASLNPML
ncbi:UNVERIFIED_CONTAM: hypothetical protein Scaly_1053700 [Sesamum calycinum]|uniref:Pentatricopeptide repeat-containing protein n=1 Tax=Sesamum calycinum TaxID=2727403 RepID=A0AAW2QM23_9LAMI